MFEANTNKKKIKGCTSTHSLRAYVHTGGLTHTHKKTLKTFILKKFVRQTLAAAPHPLLSPLSLSQSVNRA